MKGKNILINDEYSNINYNILENKYVDAHELVSYLVGSIRADQHQDISTYCYESVISFVFSHLKDPHKA